MEKYPKIDTLYVFAVGGTGERVMRSLIIEIAGGLQLNCNALQPVIVDSDDQSHAIGNVNKIIKAYHAVRNLYELSSGYVPADDMTRTNSMFKVQINDPILLNISGMQVETLQKLVNVSSMNDDLLAEFNSLYSESSQTMNLSWGFVGNPSIGSVVLTQMLESDLYKNRININSNDAVFIVGSIFGGTGAAGIPLLINKIRKDLEGDESNFRMGALAVFPYFNLEDVVDDSAVGQTLRNYDVNPNDFSTKTKAALNYYDKHVHALSSMYYIGTGDYSRRSRFKKFKGGAKQDNPANMIELLAAKAVSHFTFEAQPWTSEAVANNFSQFTKYYEYYIKEEPSDGTHVYDLRTVDSDPEFRKVFVRLALFDYIWDKCAKLYVETKGNQWATMTELNKGRFDDMKSQYLDAFLSEYKIWQKELMRDEHREGFQFRYFNIGEASAIEQSTITNRFYPSIDHKGRRNHVTDPLILDKMQNLRNKNGGDKFNQDLERYKYAFFTTIYAVEHVVNGTNKEQCININFVKE